jgi:hypothetical protein
MPVPSGAYQFDSRIGVNPHKHTSMQVGVVLLIALLLISLGVGLMLHH